MTQHQDDDEYRLLDVDQPSADNRIVYQKYIPVVCGLCGTRIYGTEDQVGQRIACPDCGRQCVIPPPPVPARRRPSALDPDEPGFELHDEPAAVAEPATPDVAVVEITCPHCATSWRAVEAGLADWQICHRCGSSFQLPARSDVSLEENNSSIQPFSIPVLKFVARGWWLWLLFYGLVIVVAAALGAVVWLLVPLVAAGQNVAVSAAAVAGFLIYFRMLGRLVRE